MSHSPTLSGILLILSLSDVISVPSITTLVFTTDGDCKLTAGKARPHWQYLSGEDGLGRDLVRRHVNGICLRCACSSRRLLVVERLRNKHDVAK